jgi:hypothetical protein
METWGSVGSLAHCCRLRTPPRMAFGAPRDFWELAKPVVGPFAGEGDGRQKYLAVWIIVCVVLTVPVFFFTLWLLFLKVSEPMFW